MSILVAAVCFGDFYQLPPVMEKPLYTSAVLTAPAELKGRNKGGEWPGRCQLESAALYHDLVMWWHG